MSDDHDRRAAGREWLYLGLLANIAVSLGWAVFFQYFLTKLNAQHESYAFESRDELFAQLDMVSSITSITGLLASIAMVIGLGALLRGARGGRALGQAAMVALAASMVVDLVFLFFQFKGGQPVGSAGADVMDWARYVNVVAQPALIVCLALALHRAAASEGAALPPWVAGLAILAAAIIAAIAVHNTFGEPGERSGALRWLASGGSVLAWLGCAILARRVAVAARGPDGWPRVARGLDLFGKALVARVAFGLAGTLLVVFAAFGAKSLSMVQVLGVLVPLTSIGCLLAMATAAIRIASAPEPGAVRGVATVAALLLVASSALGAHVMIASYQALDSGNPSLSTAMQLMKQELFAGLAATVAIALVLDAARRIAVQYGEMATAQRAAGLLVALLLVIGGQALLNYKPFLMEHVTEPGTAVFFLLVAAVVVLVVVLQTGRLARDLCAVIDRGAPPARAVARVVDRVD